MIEEPRLDRKYCYKGQGSSEIAVEIVDQALANYRGFCEHREGESVRGALTGRATLSKMWTVTSQELSYRLHVFYDGVDKLEAFVRANGKDISGLLEIMKSKGLQAPEKKS